jgi:hypothetical protein
MYIFIINIAKTDKKNFKSVSQQYKECSSKFYEIYTSQSMKKDVLTFLNSF